MGKHPSFKAYNRTLFDEKPVCEEKFQPNETVLQVSESGWRRLRWRRTDWGQTLQAIRVLLRRGLGGLRERVDLSRGPLRNPSTSARFATMLRSVCVAESRSNRIQRVAPRTAPGSSSNESALPQRPKGSRNFAASRWSAPHFVQGGSPALATTLRFPRVGAHRRTQFPRFGHPARGLSI